MDSKNHPAGNARRELRFDPEANLMHNRDDWTDEDKRVNRLAQAHPYDLALVMTPERDPDGYAQGYWLVDARTSLTIFPDDAYGASLDEIEAWLCEPVPKP
jgi:hypothetical protein